MIMLKAKEKVDLVLQVDKLNIIKLVIVFKAIMYKLNITYIKNKYIKKKHKIIFEKMWKYVKPLKILGNTAKNKMAKSLTFAIFYGIIET